MNPWLVHVKDFGNSYIVNLYSVFVITIEDASKVFVNIAVQNSDGRSLSQESRSALLLSHLHSTHFFSDFCSVSIVAAVGKKVDCKQTNKKKQPLLYSCLPHLSLHLCLCVFCFDFCRSEP